MRVPVSIDSESAVEAVFKTADGAFLRLLPWLALRYNFADGSFVGKGVETTVPVELLTAQATAILGAVGLHGKLPYIVRMKLDAWPAFAAEDLAKPSQGSPLALVCRDQLAEAPEEFTRALESFLSSDGGYALKAGRKQPGLIAAAHHLLVEVRPAWFARRGLPVPPLDETTARQFCNRLFPAFSA